MIGLLFDVLGTRGKKHDLLTVGYYNLAIATLTAPITLITGLLAWQFAYGGVPLQGYLLTHLLLGITTTVLLVVLWGMRSKRRKQGEESLNRGYLALAGITLLVLILTGHLGGFLAYGA
jgi:uncharacterized membrane protein